MSSRQTLCVFIQSVDAVNFAVDLHIGLMSASWPAGLFSLCPSLGPVSFDDSLIFHGLRAKVGVSVDVCSNGLGAMVTLSSTHLSQVHPGQLVILPQLYYELSTLMSSVVESLSLVQYVPISRPDRPASTVIAYTALPQGERSFREHYFPRVVPRPSAIPGDPCASLARGVSPSRRKGTAPLPVPPSPASPRYLHGDGPPEPTGDFAPEPSLGGMFALYQSTSVMM